MKISNKQLFKSKIPILCLLGVFSFYLSCTDDLEIINPPSTDLLEVNLVSVNGFSFEAEVISNSQNVFEVVNKGFIISLCDFECDDITDECGNEVMIVNEETCPSSDRFFCGSARNLQLGQDFSVRAFIEIKNPSDDRRKKICSNITRTNSGNISVIGFAEILNLDENLVRLSASVNGLIEDDVADDHGFIVHESTTQILPQDYVNPEELLLDYPDIKLSYGNFSIESGIYSFDTILSDGIYYYVIPFIEYDGNIIYDTDDETTFNFKEVFIGDFWKEIANNNKEDYPRTIAEAVSFSIGDLGYIGTGHKYTSNPCLAQGQGFITATFWSYDPVTDTYTSLANYPGVNEGRRKNAVGFSLNGKGYIGTGRANRCFNSQYNDFYEYTPETDTWRKVADFPYAVRSAVSFVIGDYAYVGAGWRCGNGCTASNELWRFDTNGGELDENGLPMGVWEKMEPMPTSNGRRSAVGFSLNGKGYIVTGVLPGSSGGHFPSVYEYDPIMNSWEKKNDFPGGPRQKAVSFVIGDEAYVCMGSNAGAGGTLSTFKDLWKYDAKSDSWAQKADMDEFNMDSGTGFSVNGKGYVYAGYINISFQSISQNMRVYTPEK